MARSGPFDTGDDDRPALSSRRDRESARRARGEARRPTMLDVARRSGVSLKTVSRVVNGEPTVNPAFVERVLDAVSELGFRRNDMAKKLRSGTETSTIGLIIEDIGNPFYAAITRAVERVARSHGSLLLTSSSEEDPSRERELVLELCARRVDGLIIVPAGTDHAYCLAEMRMGTPMVFLDRPPFGADADTVLLDNVGGARKAAHALADRGHVRVAVIGHDDVIYTMRERSRGFCDAMAERGLPVAPQYVRLGPGTPQEAASATAELLELPEPPTAIFSCNNRMTAGVTAELVRRGQRVDVVAFDEVETPELFPWPVTVVGYDVARYGSLAAERLFERIAGDRSAASHVEIETYLVHHEGRHPGAVAAALP